MLRRVLTRGLGGLTGGLGVVMVYGNGLEGVLEHVDMAVRAGRWLHNLLDSNMR